MKISNKTILLTGGATGIGFELAKLLVAQGNTVLTCGRRQARLEEAARSLPGLKTYVCDVGDSAQCRAMVEAIRNDGHKLDILINNAAVLTYDDLGSTDLDIERIRAVFNGNVIGPMELVKLFLPDLEARPGSMIVNVDSPAGRCAMHKLPIYAASKAALDFYTRSLRDNLQGRVKVVEVFPPTVDTEMVADIEPALTIMTPASCAQSLLRQLEAGRNNIWIGLDANLFRWMDFFLHPLVEMIVNSPIGVKKK